MPKITKTDQIIKVIEKEIEKLEGVIAFKQGKGMKTNSEEVKLFKLQQDLETYEDRLEAELEAPAPVQTFQTSLERDEWGRVVGILDWEFVSDKCAKDLKLKKINSVITNESNDILKKDDLLNYVTRKLGNSDPNIDEKVSKKIVNRLENKQIDIEEYFIVCKNGRYDIKEGTFEYGNFDSVNQIPWNYVPDATSPLGQEVFKRYEGNNIGFIDQVFEAAGLMMAQSNGFGMKTSVFANGKSNYGKSTIFENMLMPAIGKNNLGFINFQTLDDQELASFINKTCVYDGDMSKGHMDAKAIATFKKITGDTQLKAKVLYKDRFIFDNYATAWINCNGLPRIIDRGSGGSTENRIHVIEFTVDVKNKFPDPTLWDRLKKYEQEVSQWIVFNSLHALTRVVNKRRLTVTKESMKTMDSMMTEDPVVKWLKIAHTTFTAKVKTSKLYQEYVATHDEDNGDDSYNYGMSKVGLQAFNNTLRDNEDKFGYSIEYKGGHNKLIPGHKDELDEVISVTGYGNITRRELIRIQKQEEADAAALAKELDERNAIHGVK